MIGQRFLDAGDVAVAALRGGLFAAGRRGGLFRLEGACGQALCVAYRQLLGHHLLGHQDLAGTVQWQQGAGVTHVQVAGQQHLLHLGCQLQQAKQVGGGAARAAYCLRGLLMGELEFLHQALQALSFFQRVEVFPLHVLDQGHDGSLFVADLAHQHRHFVQARELGGAKAALTGDDLVAAGTHGAHQQGLHHALGADAFGQFVEAAFVHHLARLVLAGAQLADGHLAQGFLGSGVVFGAAGRAEQGLQAQAEAFLLGCHGVVCGWVRGRMGKLLGIVPPRRCHRATVFLRVCTMRRAGPTRAANGVAR